MKQIFILIIAFFVITFSYAAFAYNPYANPDRVNVSGYYRSNGTYVQPHQRTAPNGIKSDNLSY